MLRAVALEAHQKAAGYTIAKTRLHVIEILVGVLVLLLLTLGGGVQWLSEQWSTWLTPNGYAHGIALIGGVFAITALASRPIAPPDLRR